MAITVFPVCEVLEEMQFEKPELMSSLFMNVQYLENVLVIKTNDKLNGC